MKTFNYLVFVWLSVFAAMASAALLPENVKLVDSSQVKIIMIDIESAEGKEGQLLSGKVQRILFNSGMPEGHIDYAISSLQGNAISSGLVEYLPKDGKRLWRYGNPHQPPRWRYGASFSIELPANISDDATITLTYHQGAHADKSAASGLK